MNRIYKPLWTVFTMLHKREAPINEMVYVFVLKQQSVSLSLFTGTKLNLNLPERSDQAA